MVLVLYALFYVFLVRFIFFDSFKQEFTRIECKRREEISKWGGSTNQRLSGSSLWRVWGVLIRVLWCKFSSGKSVHSYPLFFLLLFVCCFSQVIEEVYDEFFNDPCSHNRRIDPNRNAYIWFIHNWHGKKRCILQIREGLSKS